MLKWIAIGGLLSLLTVVISAAVGFLLLNLGSIYANLF